MKQLYFSKMHRNLKTLVAVMFLFNAMVFGQNLVLNPSFESVNIGSLQCSWYTSVPQFNNAINNWTLPTGGSTDIFNTALATSCYCSPFSTNTANPGQQAPRTGNGYCNIVTYGNGGCDPWREYLQGQLSSALVVGTTYEVEMWVSLADKMSVGTNNIGVKFSTNPYTQGGNCGYYTTPDLNYTGPIILDKQNWVQILFCYTPTAAGLDNFIIGNFYNDLATSTAPASGITSQTTIRYYVEDVRIEAIVAGGGGNAGTPGTISMCSSDPTVNLFNALGGTPDITGTWSGPSTLGGGYLGTFNPSTNAPGTYTYSVTGGGTGPCATSGGGSSSATVVATIISNYDATITPVGPFCTAQPSVTLSAVDPGGTWSGTGITNPVSGTFDPATAGVGTYTITYSIPGACGDVQTTSITINAPANATISPVGPYCISAPVVNLTGVDPGGTWSGTGITNGSTGAFNPSVAGVGTHTITYTIPGICGDVETTTITVDPAFDATITPVGPFCELEPALNLTAVDPGGTWSGTGITNAAAGTFDPGTAGIGTHTITYTIPGTCGDMQTTTITIGNQFDATITPAGPFCTSDPAVQLTAVNGSGTWSGTGITSTGMFTPSMAGSGTFTITYTISGVCGDVQTTSITVGTSFDATITPVGPFCANDPSLQLTAVDAGGTWSGTGITNATNGTFDPAIAGAGTHAITYSILGNCGDVNTISITIIPQADATISPAGPFCEQDQSTQLSAADPGGVWSGVGIVDPNNGIFDPVTAGTGSHIITYTIAGSCGDVQSSTIVVNALDDPGITAAGPFCLGSPAVTLISATTPGNWSGTGITDPVNGTFDVSIAGSGSHLVTYVTNDLCPNTGSISITILDPLNVAALQNATICDGESSNLSAAANGGDGNYTYTWADQNAVVVGSGTNITVSPSVTTTYTVIVSDGCTTPPATDFVTITVIPIPAIDFTVDNATGCAPLEVIFTNNSIPQGTNCEWSFGDGTTSTNCGSENHTYTDLGCYDVTLTVSQNGCTNSMTQANMICLVDDPIANFSFTPLSVNIFDPEIFFTNSSLNETSYSWNFGDGSGSSLENPSHLYAYEEGDYTICLTVYNDYNCVSEICKPLVVNEGLIFYMPNTFTPDGDAFNQTFQPVFTTGFDPQDFNLFIFNRWGEVIWESHDASIGWDGTYNGSLVQNGTYVWKVEFKVLENDERMIRTGHVNVLR